MDELELLKKDWNKTENAYQQKSSTDIYSMLKSKSSSIVKTLLYISIAELLFWIVMNFIPLVSSKEYNEKLDSLYGNEITFTVLSIISFGVIFVFIYLLYRSYKQISVNDNAKILMERILNTRKVVKYYVICNLALFFIMFVYTFYFAISHNPELTETFKIASKEEITPILLKFALVTAITLGIFWLFYRLIYGILTKRLKKNYKELKKLEH